MTKASSLQRDQAVRSETYKKHNTVSEHSIQRIMTKQFIPPKTKEATNSNEELIYTHFNLQRNVVGFFSRFSILSLLNNGVLLLSPICDPLIEPWPFVPEANIWVFCSTLFCDSRRCCLSFSSCFCFSYSLFFLNLLSSSVSTRPVAPGPGPGLLLLNGGFCSFLDDDARLGCLLSLLGPAEGGMEEGNGGGDEGCTGGGGGGGDEGGGGGGGGCIDGG